PARSANRPRPTPRRPPGTCRAACSPSRCSAGRTAPRACPRHDGGRRSPRAPTRRAQALPCSSMIVARAQTPRGELALRRDGAHFEIISNGVFLMDTRDGRSERLLATVALDVHPAPRRVLVGGLGVGFTLGAVLADPRVAAVTVVEVEPVIV